MRLLAALLQTGISPLNFCNGLIERHDKLVRPERGDSETLSSTAHEWHPPAAILHRIAVEDRAIVSAKLQDRRIGLLDGHGTDNQVEATLRERHRSLPGTRKRTMALPALHEPKKVRHLLLCAQQENLDADLAHDTLRDPLTRLFVPSPLDSIGIPQALRRQLALDPADKVGRQPHHTLRQPSLQDRNPNRRIARRPLLASGRRTSSVP